MNAYTVASTFLLCLLFSSTSVADEKASAIDVSGELNPIVLGNDLPGIAVVVLRGDKIIAQGAAGVRKRGAAEAITINDQFHIGSDAKAITATLCAILVEEGKLRWDSTIGEVLASYKKNMHPAWRDVTLQQLLVHRGGAPESPDPVLWRKLFRMQRNPGAARRALLRGVLLHPPAAVPGTRYIYSNTGYAIAGHMAEVVANKPYEKLMAERIFKPLGMTSAGFRAPGKRGQVDQPLGHTDDGTPVEPGPGADNPPAISPAGTMHVSLPDWAKFVALHLNAKPNGKQLLTEESIQTLHTPVGDYAMGWIVLERPWSGGPALHHVGSNTLWLAVAWLAPEKQFAVLIATNQAHAEASTACNEVATAMIQRFCPN